MISRKFSSGIRRFLEQLHDNGTKSTETSQDNHHLHRKRIFDTPLQISTSTLRSFEKLLIVSHYANRMTSERVELLQNSQKSSGLFFVTLMSFMPNYSILPLREIGQKRKRVSESRIYMLKSRIYMLFPGFIC